MSRTTTSSTVLGAIALLILAGCASGGLSATEDESYRSNATIGPASPPSFQSQILNCRNRGVYNRAADACVSEGP